MGGEKREEKQAGNNWEGSPPHGRGKAAFVVRFNSSHRITPAWAGKSSNRKSVEAMARDHPRMGGEKRTMRLSQECARGSPPHGRGKVLHRRKQEQRNRITPAWAGKSSHEALEVVPQEDHPRMGGEKEVATYADGIMEGSPPHGRGKVCFGRRSVRPARITPAWAGKSIG